VPFIRSMGIGGMLVPVSAVLTGLTLLPAVLCALGRRVDSLRIYPRGWRLREGAIWGPLATGITRFGAPVAAIALAGIVVLALQAPKMGIDQDQLSDAPDVEAVQAGRLVAHELGGAANPNVYVIDTGRAGGAYDPGVVRTLAGVADDLRNQPMVSGVTWPTTADPAAFRAAAQDGLVDATGRYALMSVAPKGDPVSDPARALNGAMRDREGAIIDALPRGGDVLLTGEPAMNNQFNDAIYGPFPWLVAGVLVLTFIALMRAFRSWVVPLVAVVMSGLSLLAAYGLLHLVFMEGVGRDLLGVDHDVRGIANWVPVFVFAFLFGISMDYQVFLTERIRELRHDGARNGDAVRGGLRGTGRIIVTAALIMVVAFGGFAMGSDVGMKEFGFGLAAAVAIDAILIRCLIVPCMLAMAGERTWRRRREAVPA
ncbi:MAG TPA: MMPL family transporter, partial [Miltoncostaea sp.]|nr:MMPL family transporter [Miltoncostaea sp.]